MAQNFIHLKIAHKLSLGFGIVLLFLISALATDTFASTQQTAVADRLVHHLYPEREAAELILILDHAAVGDGGAYLLSFDKSLAATYLQNYNQDVQQLREELARAWTLADTDGQRNAIQQFTRFYFGTGGYYQITQSAFTQKRNNQIQIANNNFVNTPNTPELVIAKTYIATIQREIALQTTEEETASHLVLLLSLSLGGLATILGMGIAILIARSITRPLAQVQQAVRQVSMIDVANLARGLTALSQGDLTVSASTGNVPFLYESRDEIGQTALALRTIISDIHTTVRGYEHARLNLQDLYSDLNEKNLTLQSLLTVDPLTGLGNHYSYQEQITRALDEARHGGEPLILALLDIDEFKVINDEQGHQRGDEILCTVAILLREANLSNALPFYLGADDFAVIMPRVALAKATNTLNRLCENVRHHFFAVTISIGVTCTHADEITLEVFQSQADLSLQEAKRQGRNRVVTYTAIEGAASLVPLAKRQAVRRLLSERKLTVAFQPIWNLATGTVLAYEALIRPDASYGLAGPQELFDIAEQMGRAHELDAICVEKILARAAELPPDVLLFMNLTPQSLVHDLLTGAILLEAVTSAGLEPSRIVLEITERSIVNLAEVVQKAKFLQLMGFRIALDDAGAGNAGLEMLSQLPVDFVKIDRSVVVGALSEQAAHSVFVGLTTITRESHILVVAEGIENAAMLEFIQQAEVQYVQGYLLGRPNEAFPVHSALQDLRALLYTGAH